MAMDRNAGLELTNERLIPVKPRVASLQEPPPDWAGRNGTSKSCSTAVWRRVGDALITVRKMKDENYPSLRQSSTIHQTLMSSNLVIAKASISQSARMVRVYWHTRLVLNLRAMFSGSLNRQSRSMADWRMN
jgi:hypothetical protein